VHHLGGPHDSGAEHLSDALVPEAHAENRDLRPQDADDVVAHPGVGGTARAGGDEDGVGSGLSDGLDLDLVVAVHDRLTAELAEVLDEVVDERVVVVDDEDPGGHGLATLPPRHRQPDRSTGRANFSAVEPANPGTVRSSTRAVLRRMPYSSASRFSRLTSGSVSKRSLVAPTADTT
jgi:hypothetical protein